MKLRRTLIAAFLFVNAQVAVALTPMDLEEGSAPAQEVQVPKSCMTSSDAESELTDEIMRLCMNQRSGPLFAIYAKALSALPGLQGSVVLDLEISPEGKVVSSAVSAQSTLPQAVSKRISERVMTFKFPPSKSGWSGAWTFNYYPS